MNCMNCSREIPENAAFCGYCGTAIVNKNMADNLNQEITEAPSTQQTTSFTLVSNEETNDTKDINVDEDIKTINTEISTEDAPELSSDVEIETTIEAINIVEDTGVPAVVPEAVIEPAIKSDNTAHYAHNETLKTMRPQIINNTDGNTSGGVVKTSTFFWMILLLAVPFVNLILLLIWSFSEKININRRNFARAALIWSGIIIAISIVTLIIAIVYIITYGEYLQTPLTIFGL